MNWFAVRLSPEDKPSRHHEQISFDSNHLTARQSECISLVIQVSLLLQCGLLGDVAFLGSVGALR